MKPWPPVASKATMGTPTPLGSKPGLWRTSSPSPATSPRVTPRPRHPCVQSPMANTSSQAASKVEVVFMGPATGQLATGGVMAPQQPLPPGRGGKMEPWRQVDLPRALLQLLHTQMGLGAPL